MSTRWVVPCTIAVVGMLGAWNNAAAAGALNCPEFLGAVTVAALQVAQYGTSERLHSDAADWPMHFVLGRNTDRLLIKCPGESRRVVLEVQADRNVLDKKELAVAPGARVIKERPGRAILHHFVLIHEHHAADPRPVLVSA